MLKPSARYFSYLIPFFSLLLGSVLVEFKKFQGSSRVRRVAVLLLCFLYVLYPLANVWAHRSYDHNSRVEQIKTVIPPDANLIGNWTYAFGFPNDRLYPDQILREYDLETLMAELDIRYFIYGPQLSTMTKASRDFLFNECQRKLTFRERRRSLRLGGNESHEIIVFECTPG